MSEYINGSTDILGGSVIRYALNTTTPNQAVIRKIIAGNGITISSTGVDPGTGDVTISIDTSGTGGSGSGGSGGGGTPTAVGTVTSVNMIAPEGMFIVGAPITTAGTISLRLSSGYVVPLYVDVQQGKTAYSWGNHALAGYLLAEADTLDSVTDRGSTTPNGITVGNMTATGLTVTNNGNLITSNQFYGLATNYANGIFVGWDVSAVYLGYQMSTLPIHIGTNGSGQVRFRNTGGIQVDSYAGTGTRWVVADANGVLSTQTISAGSSITINNNADYRVITGSNTADTLNGSTKLLWYNDFGILALNATASWGYGAEIDFVNTDVNGTTWGFYGGSTSITGLMLYQYQPTQVELAYWNTDRYAVRSDIKMAWSSTLLSWETPDIALSRESTGLLQVNTGTTNSYADVKAKVYRATQGFYAYRTGGGQAFIGLDTSGSGGKEWYMGSLASNNVDPGSIMWNNETDGLSPMSLSSTKLKLKVDTGLSWTTASTTDSVTYTVGFEVAAANTLKLNNGSTGFGYLNLNNIKASALAGTGDRFVITDATGVLATATIGSGLSYSGGVLSATGGAAGTVTGSGTAGKIVKFNSASDIGNSIMTETTTLITVAGSVNATSFVKSGGTSSQFLMADGSVTTSTFLTSGSFVSDYDSAITGLRNSSNKVYTLTNNYQSGTTKVYVNGVRYSPGGGNDYTESAANQITFTNAPDNGDLILVDYIKS